jgi:hypothetical protein
MIIIHSFLKIFYFEKKNKSENLFILFQTDLRVFIVGTLLQLLLKRCFILLFIKFLSSTNNIFVSDSVNIVGMIFVIAMLSQTNFIYIKKKIVSFFFVMTLEFHFATLVIIFV